LDSNKNQVIPVTPNNPWEINPREKPKTTKRFYWFAMKPVKEAPHHRRTLMRNKITSFGKELSNDVGCIVQNMLSHGQLKKWFHQLLATIGTTLADRRWMSPTPFVQRHCLVNNWSKESYFLMCLVFVPNDIQLGELEGGISFHHFSWINFFEASWVVIHIWPNLA
jgi:hypothetical protein